MQCFYRITVLTYREREVFISLIYLVRVSRIDHIAYCRWYLVNKTRNCRVKCFVEKTSERDVIISFRGVNFARC